MFNKKKVVVTMTTYPARHGCLKTAIDSILSQKEVDEIVLNLSIEEYPEKERNLPDFLRSDSVSNKISINYLYGNTKAFKKLIPTLSQKKYQDCIVITCDDDCDYPDGIIGKALDMYNYDRPVCFNVPNTLQYGNGRLSIYEYRHFGKYLTVMERPIIWNTNNDDVTYGYIIRMNGYTYEHKELDMYDSIRLLDETGDMHCRGLYNPKKDDEFMRRYILDRFGLNMAHLTERNRNMALKYDGDRVKQDNINEIVQ